MAIVVTTSKRRTLLSSLKDAVRAGTVTLWTVDSDGDFTLASDEWRHKAWLRPRITDDGLVFNILAPRQTHLSRTAYAVYHARMIQALLTHFDNDFQGVRATAMPVSPDAVSS
jgi:hypothetical protein